ncbi:MAG: tetratricopeptide repeat protein [Candidatus Bathyanammoxibius sp.]
MSRILDQLKNARKNRKKPPPRHDDASLDTIIALNTPRRPRRSSITRLIVISLIGIVFVLLAVFMALYMIGDKQSQASSRLPSTAQKQRAQRASGHAVSVSSKGEWKRKGSRELAAKKTEMLPVGILLIESIDEGPVIEEIEIGTVSPEGGEEYREPGVVLYEIETLDKQDLPAGRPGTEVMEFEPPVTPGIETIEIEEIEISPALAAPVEIEIEPVQIPEEFLAAPMEAEPFEPTPVVPVSEEPKIEIRLQEPGLSEMERTLVELEKAARKAKLAEAPPSVVMELPAPDVEEAPPIPLTPTVPQEMTAASRIDIKRTPVPVKEPIRPSPPVKVSEETAATIQPPPVAQVTRPPAAAPAPAQPREDVLPEDEGAYAPEVLEKRDRFKRAVFYQKSGELRRAKMEYMEIIRLDPMDAETHNNLGSIYQAWGDLDDAISEYRKAILLRPNYYKARNNLGVALYKKGNAQGALREFQIVVEANPRDVQSLTNLGVVSKSLGQLNRARQFFEAALAVDPSHAEAHYNLALVLEESEPASAIFHYQKFLEFSGGTVS